MCDNARCGTCKTWSTTVGEAGAEKRGTIQIQDIEVAHTVHLNNTLSLFYQNVHAI
jgi:hypothetical protein